MRSTFLRLPNIALKVFSSFIYFFNRFGWLIGCGFCSDCHISDCTRRHQPWNPNWRQIFSARSGFFNSCFPTRRSRLPLRWRSQQLSKQLGEKISLEHFESVLLFSEAEAMFVVCSGSSVWGTWSNSLKSFGVSAVVVLHSYSNAS